MDCGLSDILLEYPSAMILSVFTVVVVVASVHGLMGEALLA